MDPVNIRFNPDRSRWEALREGEEVGALEYQVNCSIVDLARPDGENPLGPSAGPGPR